MNLRKFVDAKWYIHFDPWWQVEGGDHSGYGFNSADPEYCMEFGSMCKDINAAGAIINYYGNGHDKQPSMYAASLQLLKTFEQLGLEIGLNFDQNGNDGKANDTRVMLSILDDARKKFFGSPAMMRDDDGKLLMSHFDAWLVDWHGAIASAYPDVRFLDRDASHPGHFSWWQVPGGTWQLIKDNQTAALPCVIVGVNDTSPWGAGRKIPYNYGQTFLDICAAMPKGTKRIQLATGQDFQEGTGIEGNLRKATGYPLYKMPLQPIGNIFDDLSPVSAPKPKPVPMSLIASVLLVIPPPPARQYRICATAPDKVNHVEVRHLNTKLCESLPGADLDKTMILPPGATSLLFQIVDPSGKELFRISEQVPQS